MDRLAKALVGDWDTVETMERGQFFPNGGSREGTVHARLASGGIYTALRSALRRLGWKAGWLPDDLVGPGYEALLRHSLF